MEMLERWKRKETEGKVPFPASFRFQPLFLAALAVLSLLYFLAETRFFIWQWESEGSFAVPSLVLLRGGLPYRDIITYTPPGFVFLLAAAYKILGLSLVANRVVLVALPKWIIVLLSFDIARRAGLPRAAAALCAAFTTLGLGTGTFTGIDFTSLHPTVVGTLAAWAATGLLIRFWEDGEARLLAAAGAACGLSVLLRYDVGIYTALAHGAAIVALSPAPSPDWRESKVRHLSLYFGSCAALVAPMALFLLATVPRDNLYFSFWVYPKGYSLYVSDFLHLGWSTFVVNPVAHAMPFFRGQASLTQAVRDFALYDFFAVTIFAAYIWGWIWLFLGRKNSDGLERPRRVVGLLLMVGSFFWIYYVRTKSLFSFSIPFYVLLPALIYFERGSSSRIRAAAAKAGIGCVAILMLMMWMCKPLLARPYHRVLGSSTARGLWVPAEEAAAVEGVVGFIDRRVSPQEKILVCTSAFTRDTPLLLYVLADRLPGSIFFHFYPGVTTRPDVQKRMIADLKANRVRYIVMKDDPVQDVPAEGPLRGPKSPLLAGFILSRFRETARFGHYRVLRLLK